jgi:hypothetical protein
MSGLGARVALIIASVAAAGAGWFGAQQFGSDATTGTAVAAVDLYECPAAGSLSIGQVHAGDKVWLIGVTDDRWAVIRNPDSPDRPAWLPLAMVASDATAGDLPELTCGQAVDVATTASTATTATSTSASSTPSSVVLATSTSTSSTSTSTTTTTIAADVTPPTVTLTTDRAYVYVRSGSAPCSNEDSLEVTIVVADPTVPLSIRSIVATWNAPAGPQTANLVPVGGTRFSLEVAANGPPSGETPLTLTATGSDGVGNVGTGQIVVSLRDPGSFGCAG